jgi:hypothetical protein
MQNRLPAQIGIGASFHYRLHGFSHFGGSHHFHGLGYLLGTGYRFYPPGYFFSLSHNYLIK